jgi:hypothetical protein
MNSRRNQNVTYIGWISRNRINRFPLIFYLEPVHYLSLSLSFPPPHSLFYGFEIDGAAALQLASVYVPVFEGHVILAT